MDPIGHHRANKSLQRELADRLSLHQVFDSDERALANQDFAIGRLVAKSRGEVGDRANGGVADPSLEPDLPGRFSATAATTLAVYDWLLERLLTFDAGAKDLEDIDDGEPDNEADVD